MTIKYEQFEVGFDVKEKTISLKVGGGYESPVIIPMHQIDLIVSELENARQELVASNRSVGETAIKDAEAREALIMEESAS